MKNYRTSNSISHESFKMKCAIIYDQFNKLIMKTTTTLIGMVLMLVLTISCNDNEQPAPMPVTVNFPSDLNGAVSIDENQRISQNITLSLSAAVPADGSVLITFPPEGYFERFATDPGPISTEGGKATVQIPLKQGQTETQFRFIALDNTVADGDISVRFSLTAESVNPVATPGTNSELTVTIVDDEVPVPIGFDPTKTTIISKNQGDFSISVLAPDFVRLDGTAKVNIESSNAVYGTHYTTFPDGSTGSFQLNYPRGWTNDVFILKTIPTSEFNEPLQLKFTIIEHVGGVIPSNDATLLNEVTITITPN